MKRSLALATLLASSFVLGAAAQTPPATAPPGPVKVGIITFQMAVAQTNEGQRNFADLQKKYLPKETQLKAQSDEVDSLTKQLQAQGASLSDAARASQARTIDEKKKKLERDAEDLRAAGAQEANEMYNSLASKVYDVLVSYSTQHGYTLVLDFTPQQQQQNPILYAVDNTNITKPVIDAYNLKSGIPAPPPQPAAPAGAAAKPPASH